MLIEDAGLSEKRNAPAALSTDEDINTRNTRSGKSYATHATKKKKMISIVAPDVDSKNTAISIAVVSHP